VLNESNIQEIFSQSINGWASAPLTKGRRKYREKSKEWINFLAEEFRSFLKKKNVREIIVFPPEKECLSAVYKNRREFLFDIHICKYSYFQSSKDDEKRPFICKSIIAVESEFKKGTPEAVEDLSKLLCSNAEIKIFIGPYYEREKESNYIPALKAVSLQNSSGQLYVALVPHPKDLKSGKNDWRLFRQKQNDLEEVKIL
jgi:hypothetical protein